MVNGNPNNVEKIISQSNQQNLVNIVNDLNNPQNLTQLVNNTNPDKLSDVITDSDNDKLTSIIDETVTYNFVVIVNDVSETVDLTNSINKIVDVNDSIKLISDVSDTNLVSDVINIFTTRINALAIVVNDSNIDLVISNTNNISSNLITSFLETNIDDFNNNGDLTTFLLAQLPN